MLQFISLALHRQWAAEWLCHRRLMFWLLGVIIAGSVVQAAEPHSVPAFKPATIRLQDASGKWSEPLQLGDAKAIVFVFVSVECPISNSYAPKLRRISDAFAAKGVLLRLVYPNPDEDEAKIQKHLKEYELPFTAYRDPHHDLVKAAGVHVTPEAAVYVTGKGWVYHGRIDNRYVDFGKARPAATHEDLQEALTAVASGNTVKVSSTRAIGCSISAQP